MCKAIAHSLCQASAQIYASVQNIHIPADGILVGAENLSFDSVVQALVDDHLQDSKMAAFLCGTLVTEDIYNTIKRVKTFGAEHGTIVRDSSPYDNPGFPDARTATPLMVQVTQAESGLYREEIFGPISFLIKGDDADACLRAATKDAKECGAITSHVYSINADFLEKAQDEFNLAGASVACNLIGMPINFAAAYSDFHVTGMNPAGNACLTDLAFVANRFRIVQRKIMV